MATIVYNIRVDSDDNVTVTTKPPAPSFKLGKDSVRFKSNDPAAAIQYVGTSPFSDPAVKAGKLLKLGPSGKGPFKIVNPGKHHFVCGRFASGKFSSWGGGGGDTPVEP